MMNRLASLRGSNPVDGKGYLPREMCVETYLRYSCWKREGLEAEYEETAAPKRPKKTGPKKRKSFVVVDR